MTAQPRRHRDREPGTADSPRRTSGPPPHGDDIAAGTASRNTDRDSHGGWLAYSVEAAARLASLSRDLLHDQLRLGNRTCVNVGRRRLITRQHLQQFPGIAS
jgi:hypothetical protein